MEELLEELRVRYFAKDEGKKKIEEEGNVGRCT